VLQAGAKANQTVHSHADEEIDQDAGINLEALVLERLGQMREKREVVDGIAEKDGNEIFEPSPRSRAEDFLLFRQGPMHPRA